MSRHRKFIKSEKTKTKLKGNKLAKGLNVTKTDFKIKKIIIREQIKDTTLIEDGAEIRSQNIKVSKLRPNRLYPIYEYLLNSLGATDQIEPPQCN